MTPSLPVQPSYDLSVVIPVYGNEGSIPELLRQLNEELHSERSAEVVFVVDGSPDGSLELLAKLLPDASIDAQLIAHSRNFGSFAAIRTGLLHARGRFVSVIAADLQEPTDLVVRFRDAMVANDADVAVGVRRSRSDRKRHRIPSELFWGTYRRVVQPQIPRGGVDVFGCSARFRDELVRLEESNSSLVGLLFWIGFPRVEVEYDRRERTHGTSGWTFARKVRYLTDSVFSFTDLPIRIVTTLGLIGVVLSILTSLFVVSARLLGLIAVPGYAGTILAISFFAALNLLSIGILGSYLWRTFENTKRRPGAVVLGNQTFDRVRG